MAGVRSLPYRTGVALHTGLSARVDLTVTEADTAVALRSGDVPVLATPRLVALCEEASAGPSTATFPRASPAWPSGCSSTIWCPWASAARSPAEATLDRIEGRRLTFTVAVTDGSGLVGAGKVSRVMVDRSTFLTHAR